MHTILRSVRYSENKQIEFLTGFGLGRTLVQSKAFQPLIGRLFQPRDVQLHSSPMYQGYGLILNFLTAVVYRVQHFPADSRM